MKKLVKIIELPTQKKVKEGQLYRDVGELKIATESNRVFTGINLYLISDDEIKEGDWQIVDNNILCRATKADLKYIKENPNRAFEHKKVIASTDRLIILIGAGNGYEDKYLPQIPESFIKAFVDANGKIDEVMVEYEITYTPSEFGGDLMETKLKLRDDNTVIISQAKEKIYSRDEVEALIKKAFIAGGKDCMNRTFDGPNKFIKENL